MKTIKVLLSICTLLMPMTCLQARAIRPWSYAELTAAADVVVIGKPLSNNDANDVFQDEPGGYIGVNTEFHVEDTIKGTVAAEKLTVLHFKHNPSVGYSDGMLIVNFILKEITMDARFQGLGKVPTPLATRIEIPPPEYLLFLKRISNGRYEPVTGQMNARLSVREVDRPFPFDPYLLEKK